MDIKSVIRESICSQLKLQYKFDISPEDIIIEVPTNEVWGDYSSNIAFKVAKSLKQSPGEIASNLSYGLKRGGFFEGSLSRNHEMFAEISSTDSGFINFKISLKWLTSLLTYILENPDVYGSSDLGRGKTVVIEFSQANSNKPMHVGHARNNFIGSSLSNLYKFLGYEVVRANYIGDIGIHICKSMLMYMKYGNGSVPTDVKPDHFVGNFYAMFEKESETNPNLISEAQELLRRWEARDPEVMKTWETMNNWVYLGWKKTFRDQGVEFDVLEYESKCMDIGKEIVDRAVREGVAQKDETGAVIARLEKFDLPDKVLLRSDGTSLYSTKDLQLALDSWNKYHFDERLYVVDIRQSDYFKQIFKILEILGYEWAARLYHVQYGFVTLPEGKMSSRTGIVVNSDEVFDRISELEEIEVAESLKEIPDNNQVISTVALAAFRYGLLKVDPKQDLVFDYNKVTKFEGNTGPYLLYSYARTQSIIQKVSLLPQQVLNELTRMSDFGNISDSELKLLRVIQQFGDVVQTSCLEHAPNHLCNYLYKLSQDFNSFYASNSVLHAETSTLKYYRAALCMVTGSVLKSGLGLLGIGVVDRM